MDSLQNYGSDDDDNFEETNNKRSTPETTEVEEPTPPPPPPPINRDRRERDSRKPHHHHHHHHHHHRKYRYRQRSRSPRRSRSKDRYRHRQNRICTPVVGGDGPIYRQGSQKPTVQPLQAQSSAGDGTVGFVPGVSGRFRDQIEKRKLLWQKKEDSTNAPSSSSSDQIRKSANNSKCDDNKWESTTFAQDTDGKVANKFKRLMGIRGDGSSSQTPPQKTDVMRKQQEMFTSMEQQYEIARTTTHTMRGVGLGFNSFQRDNF